MLRPFVKALQQGARFIGHDAAFVIFAGKLLDLFEVVEITGGDEFYFVATRQGTDEKLHLVPVLPFDSRENLGLQKPFISASVFRCRLSVPNTRNHRRSPGARFLIADLRFAHFINESLDELACGQ